MRSTYSILSLLGLIAAEGLLLSVSHVYPLQVAILLIVGALVGSTALGSSPSTGHVATRAAKRQPLLSCAIDLLVGAATGCTVGVMSWMTTMQPDWTSDFSCAHFIQVGVAAGTVCAFACPRAARWLRTCYGFLGPLLFGH